MDKSKDKNGKNKNDGTEIKNKQQGITNKQDLNQKTGNLKDNHQNNNTQNAR